MEDWALIRRLVTEGVPQRQVARDLGVARKTVARAVSSPSPPRYERPVVESSFSPVEARVRELLGQFPTMPATVLAERVAWSGSITWFRDNVRRLRPEYAPKDPADRLAHAAGDQAQCDLWFPAPKVRLEDGSAVSPPVLVVVASFSRFITAVMLPSRTTPDLLSGMWSLIDAGIGAVPRRLLWDNEAGIGRGGHLAQGVAEFTGALATRIVQCKPFDPESKGIVERANGFLETSFLPGRAFTSPADFNTQLGQWLPTANARTVRALHARPVDLIEADRAAMLALPPVPPQLGWDQRVRLGRDYYVRVAGNDYSVHPSAIGRIVDARADLGCVQVHLQGRLVASHQRVWARAMTITDPAHVKAAAVLRGAYQQHPRARSHEVVGRDLGEYDRAFGVTIQTGQSSTGGQVA